MKIIKKCWTSLFTFEIPTPEKQSETFCNHIQKNYTPAEQVEIIDLVKKRTLLHFDALDTQLMRDIEHVNKATSNLKNI